MPQTIQVTQDDIARGKQRSCYECPIALALIRELKTEEVCVGDTMLSAGGDVYPTPTPAYDFIHAFDQGYEVKPFTFELEEFHAEG